MANHYVPQTPRSRWRHANSQDSISTQGNGSLSGFDGESNYYLDNNAAANQFGTPYGLDDLNSASRGSVSPLRMAMSQLVSSNASLSDQVTLTAVSIMVKQKGRLHMACLNHRIVVMH